MEILNEKDRKLLEFIHSKHVASQSAIASLLGATTSDAVALQMRNVIDSGYVSIIRPLGQTSFTLTKKGIRVLNVKGETV